LLPLYYLADATVTIFRRLLKGEPVWQAHRTHFYQLATERGFLVSDVVGRVFVVNVGLCVLAVASILADVPLADVAALMLGAGMVTWLLITFARGKK
jgi:hypothetical protein